MTSLRVGVDIGGTFTDFALLDEDTGRVRTLKYPSDRERPAAPVLGGLETMLAGDGPRPAIGHFSHGTTLAVNTLLEHDGARTALLVTRGLRDLLYIGRHRLPDIFNFFTAMPRQLVRRAHVVEVDERVLADGSVARPVSPETLDAITAEVAALRVDAIAVAFLHSYRNHANEQAVRAHLAETLPGLFVSLSSEIWPQMREYERALVTVMNAYVGRRMQGYFGDLEAGLSSRFALDSPVLSTKSNGGVMTVTEAAARPTETLMSGPASGVIGAAFVAAAAGSSKVVTLDMGGTSTDVSIVDGEARYSTENQVGPFPVIMPAVDVTSIGAGGGSIASLDGFGVLKVGPESAGARPGPAAYGLGGDRPTLTDAFVCLGIIAEGPIADGRVEIRRDRAEAAVGGLARALGAGLEETAENIVRIATSQIYATLVPLLARKGVDYHDFALLPFGGAGPMHGLLVARDIGFRRAIVPAHPGVLCAVGALVADMRRDFVRTVHRSFPVGGGEDVLAAMREVFGALEAEGAAWLAAQGVASGRRRFRRVAEMRYGGQSFEIAVELGPDDLAAGAAALTERFHREYARTYGEAGAGSVIEVRDLRVTAVGATPKPRFDGAAGAPAAAPRAAETREIFHDGRRQPALFIERAAIGPERRVAGPAVISQYDTTTFVPAGYEARVDRFGNLIAEATGDAA
jgi:N-methylhydantoinase A